MLAEVLADIRVPRTGRGRPRTRPSVVVADRAYTNGVNRRMLARRGIKTIIPQKSTEIEARLRKGSDGGRPPAFDADIYKGRNVVERSFSLSKQWRGLATRYDKLAITYRAAAVLHACIRWLRLLGDTPYFNPWRIGLVPSLDTYRRHFTQWGSERYAFEATPTYSYGGRSVIEAIEETLDGQGSPQTHPSQPGR